MTTTITIRNQQDMIDFVPGVLGFHPEESYVLLTFGPGMFHARVDLTEDESEQTEAEQMLLNAVTSNGVTQAAVLMFTENTLLGIKAGLSLARRLTEVPVNVIDVVVVNALTYVGGDGVVHDRALDQTSAVTAELAVQGRAPVRSREELVRSLASVVNEYAEQADASYLASLDHTPTAGDLRTWAEILWNLDYTQTPTAEQAGKVIYYVQHVDLRDVAWSRVNGETAQDHVTFWSGLLRTAMPDAVPAVACLLAFACWQAGDGALAWCALDRATEVDPDYSMAKCITQVLENAVPPKTWMQITREDLPIFN